MNTYIFFSVNKCILCIEDKQTPKQIFPDHTNIWSELELELDTSSTAVAYCTPAYPRNSITK